MASACCSGKAPGNRRFSRTYCFQSGMARSDDPVNRCCEGLPRLSFGLEKTAPLRCDAVIAAPLFAFAFDPRALDQTAILPQAQNGVQSRDPNLQRPLRARFDQFANLVAMARPLFNESQNQEFRASFFELAAKHGECDYTAKKYSWSTTQGSGRSDARPD